MVECSYCGTEIAKGTGKMFVKDNGQILYFCKSKCEKNMLKLKRDSRKFKWTKSFVKGAAPNEAAPKKEKVEKAAAPKKAEAKK
ncbi:MAG: 50S ribosomal protein L24e [Candidatus Woesearchaeota archaeon]|jgi:large subunit ribosomal protein L24e|nr:50S ribosomal protein L24e [Candidatus Woesearchaeota archaeon]